MAKIFFTLIFTSLALNFSYSQTAQNYFPTTPGYKWYYKTTPLDSLNQPLNNLSAYRVDSFSVVQDYKGKTARFIPSKRNLTSLNQAAPYSDTNHFHFETSNGWEYLKLSSGLDSIPILNQLGLIQFLRAMENWYSVYRFAQAVNITYTIFSKDTTIQVDTLTLPLRISVAGRRLSDQTINTPAGNFLCKKFVITNTISYLISIPPLPPIAVPIVQRPDTVYISNNVWMVKTVSPSTNVDLSTFGYPVSFSVPGLITEKTDPSTSITDPSGFAAEEYKLFQNYPNPFNPSTTISYSLKGSSNVSLKIFDMLGKEVAEIVNENQNAGIYSISFSADEFNLTSGTYFYRLSAKGGSGDFVSERKMVLIK